MENNTTPSLNRIPLTEALDYIAYYKRQAATNGISGSKLIKAYLVQKKDVFGALGITANYDSQYDYFRIYIGLKDMGEGVNPEFKLFLTPVDGVTDAEKGGRDVILNGDVMVSGQAQQMDYVLDFNLPCPNTCDKESVLYKAGENR